MKPFFVSSTDEMISWPKGGIIFTLIEGSSICTEKNKRAKMSPRRAISWSVECFPKSQTIPSTFWLANKQILFLN